MLSKNEIKYIQSLGHKKNRDEEAVFIAEGSKIVQELITGYAGQIIRLYATETFLSQNNTSALQQRVTAVSDTELERISQLQTPNQCLAVVEQLPAANLTKQQQWILALDAIRDPGNMGTIIRLADWFGVGTIVLSPDCADIYNPKVVQASMGSIMRVEFHVCPLAEFLSSSKLPVFAATLNGKDVTDVEFPKNGVLIIGNEAQGIGDEVLQAVTQQIKIPKFGGAESLNAAVATGILLWEMKRTPSSAKHS
jgi:RNA methyltransferase, TrmH family